MLMTTAAVYRPIKPVPWTTGNLEGYRYEALVQPSPTPNGIEGGNITDLRMYDPDGNCVASFYGNWWNIKPIKDRDYKIYAIVKTQLEMNAINR